jgi:hypothetical protein
MTSRRNQVPDTYSGAYMFILHVVHDIKRKSITRYIEWGLYVYITCRTSYLEEIKYQIHTVRPIYLYPTCRTRYLEEIKYQIHTVGPIYLYPTCRTSYLEEIKY